MLSCTWSILIQTLRYLPLKHWSWSKLTEDGIRFSFPMCTYGDTRQIDVLDKLAAPSESLLLSPSIISSLPLSPPISEVELRKLDFGSFHLAEKKRAFFVRKRAHKGASHSSRTTHAVGYLWKGKERGKAAPMDTIMGMANTISDISYCCHVGQIIRL